LKTQEQEQDEIRKRRETPSAKFRLCLEHHPSRSGLQRPATLGWWLISSWDRGAGKEKKNALRKVQTLSGAPPTQVWTSPSSYPGVAAHIIMGQDGVEGSAKDTDVTNLDAIDKMLHRRMRQMQGS
jgi:hypothetical protein